MPTLTKFQVGDGKWVWVEVDDDTEEEAEQYRRVARGRDGELAEAAAQSLQAALESIKPAAEQLAATLQALAQRPKKVELQFGLKLSGQIGAIIASTSAEGNINVKLIWE